MSKCPVFYDYAWGYRLRYFLAASLNWRLLHGIICEMAAIYPCGRFRRRTVRADRHRLYDGIWYPQTDQLRPRRHVHDGRSGYDLSGVCAADLAERDCCDYLYSGFGLHHRRSCLSAAALRAENVDHDLGNRRILFPAEHRPVCDRRSDQDLSVHPVPAENRDRTRCAHQDGNRHHTDSDHRTGIRAGYADQPHEGRYGDARGIA